MSPVTLLIVALVAVVLVCLIWCIHDMNTFRTVSYEIRSDKLPAGTDLRLCHLSDLHGQHYGKQNGKLLATIDALHPDLILSSGDMVTTHHNELNRNVGVARDLMCRLAAKYPVYQANGNHETSVRDGDKYYDGRYEQYERDIAAGGVHLLNNASVFLESLGIRITGLEMPYEYYIRFRKYPLPEHYYEDTIGIADPDHFQILIAHNPMYFREYANWGADLTLSGHVHGGIIRLPFLGGVISPAFIPFPRYDGGLFRLGAHTMVLSRGLGTHSIPVRLNNPGELVSIRLLGPELPETDKR